MSEHFWIMVGWNGLLAICWLCLGIQVGRSLGRPPGRTAPKVVVFDVGDDICDEYQAVCDLGEMRRRGCGPTPDAALGSLVRSHAEGFGVEVEWRIGPE